MGERLQAEGWRVLARNWQGGGAEVDLIVERGDALRFVEVKARDPGDDSALESITFDKRRRLTRAADAWLAEHPGDWQDIAVLLALVTLGPEPWPIEWWDDPFDAT